MSCHIASRGTKSVAPILRWSLLAGSAFAQETGGSRGTSFDWLNVDEGSLVVFQTGNFLKTSCHFKYSVSDRNVLFHQIHVTSWPDTSTHYTEKLPTCFSGFEVEFFLCLERCAIFARQFSTDFS